MDYTIHGMLQTRILEWLAFTFSSGSSQPRDWTQVSRIAVRFLTSRATGKPKNTEWIAYPLPWNLTRASYMAGRFFTNWAIMEAVSECCSIMSDSLQPLNNSPGQNMGVDSCSLLQGIFQTQVSNPGLPYCRRILYQLSHQGSTRILEWVVYAFFSRSSWSRIELGLPAFWMDSLPAGLQGKHWKIISLQNFIGFC